MAAAAALWGTSYPAIGVAIRDADALSIALLRSAGQAVLLGSVMAIVHLRHRDGASTTAPRPDRRRQALTLVGLGLLGGFFNVGQAVSVGLSGPVAPAFVAGIYPVLTVMLATIVLREALTARVMAGFLSASVGTIMLADPGQADIANLAGLAVAATAALAFAGYLVASRHVMESEAIPPLLTTLAVFVGVVAQSALAIVITGAEALPQATTPAFIAAMTWLVLGSGILPLAMSEISVRRAPLIGTSPFLFLAPLVAAAIGLGVLGEELSPPQLVGGLLAVLGIVVATAPRRPGAARAARAVVRRTSEPPRE